MADMDRLPCGCLCGTDVIDGVNTFLFEPCALDCWVYLYVLEESAKQGNSLTIIDAR